MKCGQCVKGIIMKQIALSEWSAEPCTCTINNWFTELKQRSN
jgi:hypothetical protein